MNKITIEEYFFLVSQELRAAEFNEELLASMIVKAGAKSAAEKYHEEKTLRGSGEDRSAGETPQEQQMAGIQEIVKESISGPGEGVPAAKGGKGIKGKGKGGKGKGKGKGAPGGRSGRGTDGIKQKLESQDGRELNPAASAPPCRPTKVPAPPPVNMMDQIRNFQKSKLKTAGAGGSDGAKQLTHNTSSDSVPKDLQPALVKAQKEPEDMMSQLRACIAQRRSAVGVVIQKESFESDWSRDED